MKLRRSFALLAWLACLLCPGLGGSALAAPCAAPAPQAPRAVKGLALLDRLEWPGPRLSGAGSASAPSIVGLLQHFGGISGMDFDVRSGRWWLLSDDRAEVAPSRMYEARVPIGPGGLGTPELLAEHRLLRIDGHPFARSASGGSAAEEVADGEALRLDPCDDASLWWASEGDAGHGHPAAVYHADRQGRTLGRWPLPPMLAPAPGAPGGPRPNRSFEGLAFTPDGQALWLALEAPLPQDGDLPTPTQGALLRFSRMARDGGQQQYVYPLGPLTHEASGGRMRADLGVSEILAIDADTLLVIERAGYEVADGVFRFAARLFIARVADADEVSAWPALKERRPRTMARQLLLDMATLAQQPIDNIEAAAWGPRLPDGRATLLLVSDDNFSPAQRTQWWLFAVDEGEVPPVRVSSIANAAVTNNICRQASTPRLPPIEDDRWGNVVALREVGYSDHCDHRGQEGAR